MPFRLDTGSVGLQQRAVRPTRRHAVFEYAPYCVSEQADCSCPRSDSPGRDPVCSGVVVLHDACAGAAK
eukprot:3244752-Lingulodinium_polyedra.AAC.1